MCAAYEITEEVLQESHCRDSAVVPAAGGGNGEHRQDRRGRRAVPRHAYIVREAVTMKKSRWCVGETKKHSQISLQVTGGRRCCGVGFFCSLAPSSVTQVVMKMTGV